MECLNRITCSSWASHKLAWSPGGYW